MVSKTRKARVGRKFERTDGGTQLKTLRKYVKQEKRDRKQSRMSDRVVNSVTKKYGEHYIQNDPPHFWKCSCGSVNAGNVESKVGNAAIVRCRSCEGSAVREIKK